jgi:hypothetical protein
MWVSNFNSGSVTELSSTGAVFGTFAVGEGPTVVAFDGADIWVASDQAGTISKL